MNDLGNLATVSPRVLLEGCRTTKTDNSHEKFCFELFKRAVVDRSDACWSAIYEQYTRLVGQWVFEYAHTNTGIGGTSIDELVQDAFTGFWRSYKADHLQNAGGLGSVLRYLKSCAWSSVQHAFRRSETDQAYHITTLDEHTQATQTGLRPETAVLRQMTAEQFWHVVDTCCNSEEERLIMRLRFVNELKPGEILLERPDLASNEKELFKILRNIKDRLERSMQMQQLFKEMAV